MPVRLLHNRNRPDRRSGATANLQRQRNEEKFFHARFRQRFQVQAFDDMDSSLDQQVNVHFHIATVTCSKRHGIAAGGEDSVFAQPLGAWLFSGPDRAPRTRRLR